jgi:tetratricopeptide (TPR) repeat protein
MNYNSSQLKKIAYVALILILLGSTFQIKHVFGKLFTGMKTPSFTLNTLDGKNETFDHLSTGKKLTAIVFWTMWNKQSAQELSRLQKAYARYREKGFQVIAINVEDQTISRDQLQSIANYCKEVGLAFPILIDQNLETFSAFSIIAIPTTFLINEGKTIVYRLPGYPIAGAEQLFSTIRDIMEPGSMESQSQKDSLGKTKHRMTDQKALRYYNMAKALQETGDYSGAIESLRKSISIDPDFLAPYNLLGVLLYEKGKQKEAIDIFNQGLSNHPDDLPFIADYGNFLIQTGDAEKGLAMIRRVLKEDQNYSRGHYYLGNYLLLKGKKDEAMQEAQLAVTLNPLDFNGHKLLGSVYESMGEKKKSLAAYKKAVDLLEIKVKPQDFLLNLSL